MQTGTEIDSYIKQLKIIIDCDSEQDNRKRCAQLLLDKYQKASIFVSFCRGMTEESFKTLRLMLVLLSYWGPTERLLANLTSVPGTSGGLLGYDGGFGGNRYPLARRLPSWLRCVLVANWALILAEKYSNFQFLLARFPILIIRKQKSAIDL